MNFKNIDFKKVGKNLIPVAILFALSCIFFFPTLKGYDLRQGDMRNTAGMSQDSKYFHDKTDTYTWWNDAMFSGMPNTQIYGDYNGTLIKHLGRTLVNFGSRPIGILFLYGLCFYIMLLCLGYKKWLSLIGAIAYAYSSYFIIILEVGHVTKAMAIAFAPLVLAGVFLIFNKKYWQGMALASLAFGLEFYSNHVQITYYLLLLILIYGIAKLIEAIKAKNIATIVKPALLSIAAVLIGVFCNFPTLFNTYDYGKLTTRGQANVNINPDGSSKEEDLTTGLDRSYITNWSYGKQENLTFFIPNAVGGASGQIGNSDHVKKADPRFAQNIAQSNHYWGNQSFTAGPVYIGAGIFLLAILALVFVEGYLKWVLLVGSLLSIFLGMGKNMMWFTNIFLDFVPGYNKFRTVSMVLILLELCLPFLAVMFLKKVMTDGAKILEQKKKLLTSAGVVIGFLLILLAIPDSVLTFISDGEQANFSNQIASNPEMSTTIQQFVDGLKNVRISIFRADALRSLFIMLAVFATVYLFLIKKLKEAYFFIALGLITFGDLWFVNKRYVNNEKQNGQYVNYEKVESKEFQFAPSQNDVQIYQSELSNRPELQQKIESIAQQQVAKRGVKLSANNKELLAWNVRFGELNLNSNYRVFNVAVSPFNDASTSYFHKSIGGYHGAKLKRYQELIEFYLGGNINYKVLNMLNTKYIITQNGLQKNDQACGNAWFVDSIIKVENENEEILTLGKEVFNPSNTAVMLNSEATNIDVKATDGSISMTSYAPNKIVYQSENSSDGLAVFSEVYYPLFWKATIDGKEVDIKKANFLLRALEVPKGKHEIVFYYDTSRIETTEYVAYAGSLMLLFLLGFATFKSIKQNEDEA